MPIPKICWLKKGSNISIRDYINSMSAVEIWAKNSFITLEKENFNKKQI